MRNRYVTFLLRTSSPVDRQAAAENLAKDLRAYLARKMRVGEAINEDVDGWVLDVAYGTHVIVGWDAGGDEYSVAIASWDVNRNLTTTLPVSQFHDHVVDEIDHFLTNDAHVTAVRWDD